MNKYLIVVWMVIQTAMCDAQELRGTVIDFETKEPVPYANVYISSLQLGVVCDFYGNFILTGAVPEQVDIKVSAQLY